METGDDINTSMKQIFQFAEATFIENIHLRPNGHLLLSTFKSGELFGLDPNAAKPSPTPLALLPGSTGLTGIATIGHDVFAVTGGEHLQFEFKNNSMKVYVVSLPEGSDKWKVHDPIDVPDTKMLNGMTSLPTMPHVVLSVDSIGGRVFRIDTDTGVAGVVFKDLSLGPGNDAQVPLGANGVKIFKDYLYFTNSAQGTFARIKINDDGTEYGDVEVIARLEGAINMSNAYDDFAFDEAGNAYLSVHSNSVMKVSPDGTQTTFAGGGNDTFLKEPTSVALSGDGKSIYVATGGTTVGDVVHGGQVIQFTI